MAARKPVYGVLAERLPLSRHDILHYLRGSQESKHRREIWLRSASYKWVCSHECSPSDLDHVPEMTLEEANDCCNRTALFYVLRNDTALVGAEWAPMAELSLTVLHNYLYRKWFQPYRSEIEYGQFLAKVILPKPTPLPEKTCSQPMVDLVRALNASLCARVDAAQNAAKALKDLDPQEQLVELSWPLDPMRDPAKIIRDQDFFIP